MNEVPVRTLLAEGAEFGLQVELLAGASGLDRTIRVPRIQKVGLALTGLTDFVNPERIQIVGRTEITYLEQLSPEDRRCAVLGLCSLPLLCMVVTKGQQVPAELLEEAENHGLPLLRSSQTSSEFIRKIQSFLEGRLCPRTSVHCVLIDVLGIGILILGKSGIGKSECALDLVLRGHRLVADDVVDIHRHGYDTLVGRGSPLIRHHMEIRGLGIINIKDLFGIAAVREQKKIELVVELVEWDEDAEYDRLGVDEKYYSLLGVEVSYLVLPVRPGRNMTTIIEVAARNQLLKIQGHYSAQEFQARLQDALHAGSQRLARLVDEVE